MKDSEVPQEHLHFGHIGAITLCALVLVFSSWMKTGFSLSGFKSDKSSAHYTYAEARSEALAEAGIGEKTDQNNQDLNQLAMLDPLNSGSVLGASTGTQDSVLPSVNEILTPQILNSIPVKYSTSTGADAILNYKRNVEAVESEAGIETILSNLNSEDPKVLLAGSKMVEPLVAALSQVEVPKEVGDYHKIKIYYYLELSELADGYAGVKGVADPKQTGLNIFSLMQKLNDIASDIQAKYGVQL